MRHYTEEDESRAIQAKKDSLNETKEEIVELLEKWISGSWKHKNVYKDSRELIKKLSE